MAKTVASISASKSVHVQIAKAARKGRLFRVEQDDTNAGYVCRESAQEIDLKVTKFIDRLSGIRFEKRIRVDFANEQY